MVSGASGGAALSAVADIGQIIFSAFGLSKQREADEQARRDALTIDARNFGLENRKVASSIAFQNRQLGLQHQSQAREWKWREEEAEYQKAMGFADRFNGVLDKTPALRNNLAQLWNTGR